MYSFYIVLQVGEGKSKSESELDHEPKPQPKPESTPTSKPIAEHPYGHRWKGGGPPECVGDDQEWYSDERRCNLWLIEREVDQ